MTSRLENTTKVGGRAFIYTPSLGRGEGGRNLCHVFDFDDTPNGSLLWNRDLQVTKPSIQDPGVDAT